LLRKGKYVSILNSSYLHDPRPSQTREHQSEPIKVDFHSVQNVARSIFCDRFLLKCVQSTTANEICSAWMFVFQEKANANFPATRSIPQHFAHWMEIHSLVAFFSLLSRWSRVRILANQRSERVVRIEIHFDVFSQLYLSLFFMKLVEIL
jgi:hypothetical protein